MGISDYVLLILGICLLILRWPPKWLVNLFGRMVARGYANCLIFALWKKWTCGGKIVLQRTERNKIRWIVWAHVKWKPLKCPITGDCAAEEAFEPIDGPDKIFPPFLFKGRHVVGTQQSEDDNADL